MLAKCPSSPIEEAKQASAVAVAVAAAEAEAGGGA